MRPLEVALLLILVPAIVAVIFRIPRPWWRSEPQSWWARPVVMLSAAITVPLVTQLLLEQYRGAMLPAYIVAVILIAVLTWRNFRLVPHRAGAFRLLARITATITGTALIAVSAVVTSAFPVITLPEPSGEYATGYTEYDLVDPAREESMTPQAGDMREVHFSVWYPSSAESAPREPLSGEISRWAQNIADGHPAKFALPLALDHTRLIQTHSVRNAEVARTPEGLPILLYSPGLGSTRFENVPLFEELASHGYIVVATDHAYTSGADHPITGASKLEEIDSSIITQAGDLSFLLDHMTALHADPGSPFHERLNTERVGTLGFSLGGATAAQALALDPRFKAGMNLDGSFGGTIPESGIPSPFLYLLSPQHLQGVTEAISGQSENEEKAKVYGRYQPAVRKSTGPAWVGTIENAEHSTHTFLPQLAPFLIRDPVPNKAAVAAIQALSLDFFNHTLKGSAPQLLGQDMTEPLKVVFQDDPAQPQVP